MTPLRPMCVSLVVWMTVVSGSTLAQPCRSDCPPYLKSEDGCCSREPRSPSAPGTLTVQPSREDARVRIDDGPWLAAPVMAKSVSSDVHRVEVDAPGAETWVQQVLVRPGERVVLTPQLPARREPSACAPGQRWSDELGRCQGAPVSCPEGQVALFDRCLESSQTADPDRDLVPTSTDQCPLDAEDRDGRRDDDGCPDFDDDGDGVVDVSDRCPLAPEDRDGFEDLDGCPDPDDDGDALLDGADRCPREPEDRDGFEDEDGCPDLDDDKDGVPDVADRCPGGLETLNGHEDDDGCADALPLLTELHFKRPLSMRFSQGLTTAGGYGGPSLTATLLARWWFGLEAGLQGQLPLSQVSESMGTIAVGGAPFQLGTWLGRKGGKAFVFLEPYAHLLFTPGFGVGFTVGNRFSFRDTTTWSIAVAYETGRGPLGGGVRFAIEVEPTLDARGSFFRRGFGVTINAGAYLAFSHEPPLPFPPPRRRTDTSATGAAIHLAFNAIASWNGLGLGAQVHTSGRVLPTFELAPVRFGFTNDKDQWSGLNVEPYVQLAWYGPPGPGVQLGARLGLVPIPFPGKPTFVMSLGFDVGPGEVPAAMILNFGSRWEMNR